MAKNPENGMEMCHRCQTDCENDELTLIDAVEADENNELYDIQMAVCNDCLGEINKMRAEALARGIIDKSY